MAKNKMEKLISINDQPYPVPENWLWIYLSALSEPMCDGVHYAPDYISSGIPCFSAKDIHDDIVNQDKCFYITREEYEGMKSKINIQDKSILVTKSGSIGRSAVVDKFWEFGLVESVGVINTKGINPWYIKRLLDMGFVYSSEFLEQYTTGTTIKHLTLRLLSSIKVPVPPQEEQQRIVDRIESLFAKLDEAKEKAQTVVDGYEDRKAAILHQAFIGELTAKWRSDNTIDRNSWQTVSVKDVCHDVKVGIVIKPSQYYTDRSKGTPAFRSANVREFHVDDFDWVYLNEEGMRENQRSIVHTGDVLVVRSGNPGTACVVEEKYNGYNAIDVLIAVPDERRITAEYLCAFTNSPLGHKLVAENKRGMALTHFNVSGYSALMLELPSIPEQKEIVRILYTMLQRENRTKEAAEQVISHIDSMKKAILARAFRGELGTNDPSEPPVDIGIS